VRELDTVHMGTAGKILRFVLGILPSSRMKIILILIGCAAAALAQKHGQNRKGNPATLGPPGSRYFS